MTGEEWAGYSDFYSRNHFFTLYTQPSIKYVYRFSSSNAKHLFHFIMRWDDFFKSLDFIVQQSAKKIKIAGK